MELDLCFGAESNIGKLRKRNEDAALALPELNTFIVCDGVGGSKGGDVASSSAVKALGKALQQQLATLDKSVDLKRAPAATLENLMKAAVIETSQLVYQAAQADTNLNGMCTTMDAVWVLGDRVVIGHVGDSRVYLFRQENLYQLTEDHNLFQQLLRSGVPVEQARKHPHAAHVTKILGLSPVAEVDAITLEMMSQDRLLLCTDGLTKVVKNKEIADFLRDYEKDPHALVVEMIQTANERGGPDNVSAIVLDFEEKSQAASAGAKSSAALSVVMKIEALKQGPFFQELDYAEINRLLSICSVVTKNDGDILMQEGDESKNFYILVRGDVKILKKTKKGAEKEVGRGLAGITLGESALFQDGHRTATVIASGTTELLCIEKKDFHDLMQREPELGLKVVLKMASGLLSKMGDLTGKLAESNH